MEDKIKTTKSPRHSKIVALIIAVLVVCTAAIGIFLIKDNETNTPVGSASVVEVKDEETLRELLLEESELVISVTEDIVDIEEGFTVNGTKTLKGDVTIQMKLSAAGGQSVFSVSQKASFTIDGITIDGNGVADGIYVDFNANLEVLGGNIIWAATRGINTNGHVMLHEASIELSQKYGVYVANSGEVHMEGGRIADSYQYSAYVADSGYMGIKGNATIAGAGVHGIDNYGTLEVQEAEFSDFEMYAVTNYGTLVMGNEDTKDGSITIAKTGTGGVRTGEKATTTLSHVQMYDIGTHALYAVGGTSTVKDCHFERTGSSAFQLKTCEVKIENVEVVDAKGCGIYAEKMATVEVQNFTVENCSARGVMSNGATITGDTITIKKPGSYGITNSKQNDVAGVVTVSNVSIVDSQGNGLNANGAELIAKDIEILNTYNTAVYCGGGATITLENVTIKGVINKNNTIHITEDSKLHMKGDSIVTGSVVRAVGVEGTFIMDGGTICDNDTPNNGAGVYVYKTGSFVMNGGTICNNTTTAQGGGIYAVKGSVVHLKNGSITGNKAVVAGDGILASGDVTLGKNFYMGSNEIKIGAVGVVVKIEGNKLSKHSAKDPLRVTPVLSSPEGTEVVECESEANATALASVVGSGDGSFALVQDKKYFKIQFTKADMDMTGADTVYVSDFEALKAAIESTTSKRYIVLQANIQMESKIKVPGGVTIYIKDDGSARTLSRADGNGATFFETGYGTGLYLVGTKDGNLTLNGTTTAQVAPGSIKPLVIAKGSTVIQDVRMSNNGMLADGVSMQGAFVQQVYGDINIIDSEFTNGKAFAGGALLLQNAKVYIENSEFNDNESVRGGGAIRIAGDASVEIVTSVFTSNTSGTPGGAINSDNADKLVVTDCSFTKNTSGTLGGAINVGGEGSVAFVTGTTGSDLALFSDNTAKTHGGAIRVCTGAKLILEGYAFVNNSTETLHGGAIFVDEKSDGMIKNSAFYENSAASAGGAIATNAGSVNIISCQFGEEGKGNTAGSNGGAVYVTGNGNVDMTLAAVGGLYNSLNNNTAAGSGGAIYVNSGAVTVDGYQMNNNSANGTGGALYVKLGHSANVKNATFTDNASTASSGGAVTVYGTLSVSDTTFNENTAKTNGGAIACYAGTVTGENVAFNGNAANNAGAVYLGEKASATFGGEAESSKFTDNTAANQGGAILAKEGATLNVDGYSFTGNEAVGHGGAVMVDGAATTATISNSIFTENKTDASGGAVATNAGSVNIISCQFGEEGKGNTAGSNGGAVYVTGNGNVDMTLAAVGGLYNSLNNNTAAGSGGAIYVNSGAVTVDGYQMNNNSANGTGGALYVKSGHSADVKNATFTGNASTASSGGAVTVYGTLSVSDTTFNGNTAKTNGGAIACYAGTVTGENVAFNGNAANNAGAVYLGEKASATFGGEAESSKFTDNTAANQGGAILAKEGATLNIDGYSFTGNEAVGHGGAVMVDGAATTATISNSIFTENVSTGSGGAVAANSGTVNIINADFVKNGATTGGAVYQTGDGAKIILSVENGKSGSFTDNYATAADNRRGGAVRINNGEMILSGYTFENNTVEETYNNCSTGKGNAIYVAANKTLQISDCTFASNGEVYLETGAKAYVSGNLQGVIFVYQSNGENVVIGNDSGETLAEESNVSIHPIYTENDKVLGNPGVAYDIVKVVSDENNQFWLIDSEGKLQCYEAQIGNVYYDTLEEAVTAAHVDTESDKVEITVLGDVELTMTAGVVPLQIRRYIVLKNLSGKDVVITGSLSSPQLMRVYNTNGATCSLEISGTEDGSITIDGTGRNKGAVLIRNDAGCTFTLGTNVAIINGSALTGTAGGLNNYGTANLYGDFTGNDANQGGAIYNQSSGIVNIYSGTYSGNTAVVNGDSKGYGGAIYNNGGQVNITGGTFSSNQAATSGGAIYNNGGQVNITGGAFSSNQAVASYGGAIYSNSTLSIKNAEFTGNYATGNQGGAIFHNTGQIQVDGCTFTGNYTEKAHGGAVYVKSVSTSDGAPSYIQNSFFYLNSAGGTGSSGGAIAFEGSTLSVIDCQFGGTDAEGNSLGNSAGNKGGAIYLTSNAKITVTSSTKQHVFVNNTCATANGGGAVYANSGTIEITGYIFKNNKANEVSNNIGKNSGTVTLTDCTEE